MDELLAESVVHASAFAERRADGVLNEAELVFAFGEQNAGFLFKNGCEPFQREIIAPGKQERDDQPQEQEYHDACAEDRGGIVELFKQDTVGQHKNILPAGGVRDGVHDGEAFLLMVQAEAAGRVAQRVIRECLRQLERRVCRDDLIVFVQHKDLVVHKPAVDVHAVQQDGVVDQNEQRGPLPHGVEGERLNQRDFLLRARRRREREKYKLAIVPLTQQRIDAFSARQAVFAYEQVAHLAMQRRVLRDDDVFRLGEDHNALDKAV